MNRYQKVIVCVIRSLAVGLLLYSLAALTIALMFQGPMLKLGLIGGLPRLAAGLLLFMIAVPLAKLITIGIRDE
jgi:hypothetical protein